MSKYCYNTVDKILLIDCNRLLIASCISVDKVINVVATFGKPSVLKKVFKHAAIDRITISINFSMMFNINSRTFFTGVSKTLNPDTRPLTKVRKVDFIISLREGLDTEVDATKNNMLF